MTDPNLSEFKAEIQTFEVDRERVNTIVPYVAVGPLALCTERLKLGLDIELKSWVNLYCKSLNTLYKQKMDEIFEFTDHQVTVSNSSNSQLVDLRVLSPECTILKMFAEKGRAYICLQYTTPLAL